MPILKGFYKRAILFLKSLLKIRILKYSYSFSASKKIEKDFKIIFLMVFLKRDFLALDFWRFDDPPQALLFKHKGQAIE